MLVLDTNVLIHLGDSQDPKHSAVQSFLKNAVLAKQVIGIPWVAALGYLRIATNPKIYSNPPTMSQAIEMLQAWLAQPNVVMIEPGVGHLEIFQELIADRARLDPTDAHIAALAKQRGATVVTFDRDFARFGVPFVIPGS